MASHPEFNVWVGGRWYGPSYPDAGMPASAPVDDAADLSDSASEDQVGDEPPPRSGTGSSRARWADYASAHGVTFGDDDARDDIIDACEKAGVPT